MTDEEFKKVEIGNILRNLNGADGYVVVGDRWDSNGKRELILVRQITATRPVEWRKVWPQEKK